MSDSVLRFPAYSDRADYKAKTGYTAPPFNPALPRKMWEDPHAANDPMVYPLPQRGPTGTWTLGKLIIPLQQALHPNFFGHDDFPPYVPPVSNTSINTGGSTITGTLVDRELTTLEEANALVAYFPGATVKEIPLHPPSNDGVTWGNPARRCYLLTIPGVDVNYGLILPDWRGQYGSPTLAGFIYEALNWSGVGHPGKFQVKDGKLSWIPDADLATSNTLAPVPMPSRDLAPDEYLISEPFGWSIGKKAAPGPAPAPAADGFNQSDRDTLYRIAAVMNLGR